MAKYIYLLVMLSVSMGCISGPSDPHQVPGVPPTVDQIAMDSLFQMFQRHNVDELAVVRKKDFIQVGLEKVSVKVDVEFEGMDQGQYIYAAKYTTRYSGKDPIDLEFGAIGMGAAKQEAMTVSIMEWQQQWGYTFSQFLLDRKSATPNSKGDLYESMLGIRGTFPGNVGIFGDSTNTQRIVNAISDYLPKDGVVGINLLVAVEDHRDPGGQCWINNVETPEAIEKILELDWPESDSGYIAKYYYILDQRKISGRK